MTIMTERPTDDVPTGESYEELLRTAESMDVPGYRVEVIRGKIVVSPWSRPYYYRVMKLLRERLRPHLPDGHGVDTSPFLFAFPQAGRAYGPDLTVADEDAYETTARHVDGAALSLVAELTSTSTRDADWEEKLSVYGRLVPVYLLLDMQQQEVSVYWDPSPHGYHARRTVAFGEPLPVPEPFGFDLDTTGFTAPTGR